jgi:hypothetical protein
LDPLPEILNAHVVERGVREVGPGGWERVRGAQVALVTLCNYLNKCRLIKYISTRRLDVI